MAIRLTKQIRADIIESVLKNTVLPAERKAIEEETARTAMEAVRAMQPKGFYEAVAGHPKEWFKLDQSTYVTVCNPNVVLSAVDNNDARWMNYGHVSYPEAIVVALDGPRLDEKQCKQVFGALHKRAEAWVEKYSAVKNELSAYLLSKQTVESALKDMPELERHVPAPAKPSYPLVAPSNVLSHLTKLGFDAGAPA
jgi:hypothetical protein